LPNKITIPIIPQYLIEIKKFIFKVVLGTIFFRGLLLFGGFVYLSGEHKFSCNMLNSGQYIYQELETGRLATFNMLSGYFTNGHRAEGIFICSDDFDYQCVIGDTSGLAFAVPRKLYTGTIKWNFADYEFILRQEEDKYILGTFVYGIELIGKNENEKLWYYYSPWRGILAIGVVDEKGTNTTYLVQSACGILSE